MTQYIKKGMKKWWYLPFAIYIIPNIFTCLFIVFFDLLFVDEIPVSLTATTGQVVGVLLLIMGAYYAIKFTAIRFNKIALNYKSSNPGQILGIIIFIFQLLQLAVLLVFDFGRVGGVSTSSNYFVLLVSYLPADILFLIYYGHYRSKGVPIFNLMLYILINVLQGWSGIWLILFMIEFYHQLTVRTFGDAAKKGTIILIVLIFLYPVINQLKYVTRGGEDYQKKNAIESIANLLNRLQHVTGVTLISQEKEQLASAYNRNEITPYYFDNRIGVLFFYSSSRVSLQKYITVNYLIDKSQFNSKTDTDELGWYTNVGIAGWFLILSPLQIVFYLIFIILMVTLPFLINHFFLKSLNIIPVLQTLSLIYVFHGWFTVQFSFISAMFIYVILYNILKVRKEKPVEEKFEELGLIG